MKRTVMIVNPVAGTMKIKGSMLEILQKLCDKDHKVEVVVTRSRGDAMETASRLTRENCDLIVCAGGDGTLNEVISGLVRSGQKIPIGYIPCGSTNDFAQSMKLPTNPVAACNTILTGTPKPFDIGMFCSNRNFSYIASFGAFTDSSYSTPQEMKNVFGHFAYVLQGVKSLGNIKPYKLKIEMPNKSVEGEYVFGAVANSTSIAGLFKLDEGLVDTADGKFEIILAKNPKNANELNELIGAVITANLKSHMLTCFKSSKVKFHSSERLFWTLDGEQAEGGSVVEIENMHKRIELIR